MAWVDRQSPKGTEIFYDHIGYFVHDLNEAGRQLEKLGFQVSATNIQYNEDANGVLQRTHTSNKLAKLNLGFIEVLAATGESPLANQLTNMLRRYQGLHVIALTNADIDATAKRLAEAGLEMQDPAHLRRKVTVNGKETLMVFTVLRVKPGTFTEGRLQILTNHTPENFWLPGEMDHGNRADTLTDLLICVKDVEEAVGRYETFFGAKAIEIEGIQTLDLSRGRFHFVTPDQVAAMLPGFNAPTLPYTCGQGLGSLDLKATKKYFNVAGISPIFEDDDFYCIGPKDALGAYLLFHNKSVEAPWASLSKRT
ncbi:MAG: hypothetical protein CMP14_05645 [Rickettsiales bacterium]|nr:hypothetical protein [Rickettsiales bacterium]